MKAVMQLVDYASLTANNKVVSEINNGALILVGVNREDVREDVFKLAKKIVKTRIFKDSNDKINLNITDVQGEILLVSNFTLQADMSHGNRPNFSFSAKKEKALELYNLLADQLELQGVKKVLKGAFGEHMEITTKLNGPITLIYDSLDIK